MSLFFEDDESDIYDYFPGEFVYGDDVYVPDEYMGEKWWYVSEAPGYMVSDRGRVWSEKTQRFLKIRDLDDHGHLGVAMSRNGKDIYRYVHRLIGKAFIPNPTDLPIVRHLNDIPYDNVVENLEWGTQKDNMADAKANGRTFRASPEVRKRISLEQSIPIRCVNLETGEEKIFSGQNEAARQLGLQQANIWKVLNKQRAKTCGYYFEYLDGR